MGDFGEAQWGKAGMGDGGSLVHRLPKDSGKRRTSAEEAVLINGEMLKHMERQTIALERIAEAARGIVEVQLKSAAFMELMMTSPEGTKKAPDDFEDFRDTPQGWEVRRADGWSPATPDEVSWIISKRLRR